MINRIIALMHKYSELIRYLIVGGLNTVFGIGLFWLLEAMFGIQYLIANTVAWIVSIILVFFANKYVVFRSKAKSKAAIEMLMFFGTRAAAGLVEMGLLYMLVDGIHFAAFPSKCAATVITIVLNYLTSKLIVFKNAAS